MTTHKLLTVVPATLVLVVLAVGAAHVAPTAPKGGASQPGPGGPGMKPPTPDQIAAGMAVMLSLSKAQEARLRPIYAAQAKQMKTLWGNTKLTPGQAMARMRALQKSTDQQMRRVLTPAQVRKLDDMELDGLTRYLGLSEKQRGRIRPILASRKQRLEALADNTKLNGQQRFAETGSIFESSQKQIRAVLTTAQKKRVDQGPQGMPGLGGGGRPGGKPPQ
jgi:Spy/CpxP family protein refolding chaperone